MALNVAERRSDYVKSSRPRSELIPWRMFWNNSLVYNKDGSFLACYRFDGVDMDNVQESEVDRMAHLLEVGTRIFNERNMIWSRVDRRRSYEYPRGIFPDPISQAIDDERFSDFQDGNQFINRHYVAVLHTAQRDGVTGLFDTLSFLMNERGMNFGQALIESFRRQYSVDKNVEINHERMDRDAVLFEDLLSGFNQSVKDLGFQRLRGDDYLRALHAFANPGSPSQKTRAPRHSSSKRLDKWISDNQHYVGHDTLLFEHINNAYVAAAGVKEWPEWTEPGLLNGILAVPGEVTVSQCFRFVSEEEARNQTESAQKQFLNSQKSIGAYVGEAMTNTPSDRIDEGKLAMANDASDAKASISAERMIFGWYNLTVLAYGQTSEECQETLSMVTQAIRDAGYLVTRETLHLLSAWAGTLPGQWGELVRWHFINNANMADLFPMLTLHEGNIDNPVLSEQTGRDCTATTVFMTPYGTPYYFSFHNTEVAHTIVLGPTGTGKTIVMNFLISQFRKYYPCNIYIFDKDKSCRIPTLLQGGTHHDLSGETGNVRLNPLKYIGDRNNWLWLSQWIEMLLCSRGYTFKTGDDEIVHQALESVASSTPKLWRLRSLQNYLGTLADHLAPWVWDGPLAKYFDNEEDDLEFGRFNCFEMGGILRDERLASAFMDYAFLSSTRDLMVPPPSSMLRRPASCWPMSVSQPRSRIGLKHCGKDMHLSC